MTKEFLRDYRSRVLEAGQLRSRIEELCAVSSPVISGMPHGSGDSRPAETMALGMAALLDTYEAALARLDSDGVAIEQAIAPLESNERMVVRARYLSGLRWEEVCTLLNYSWRQVHRLHASALKKLNT